MSEIKKKIKDLKNIIRPYQKKLSDWYKEDKNVKKFIEVISPYKNKFSDFYKKNNKNKNIVRAGAVVLVLIVGNGFLGGGSKWSNKEKNKFTDLCINGLGGGPNYSKLVKKYCECSTDFLSNRIKFKDLTGDDELVAVGVCKHNIEGKKAERALLKDMGL